MANPLDASKERREKIAAGFKQPKHVWQIGGNQGGIRNILKKIADFYKMGYKDFMAMVDTHEDLGDQINEVVKEVRNDESKLNVSKLPSLPPREQEGPLRTPPGVSVGKSTAEPKARGSAMGTMEVLVNRHDNRPLYKDMESGETWLGEAREGPVKPKTFVAGEEKSTGEITLGYQPPKVRRFNPDVGDLQAKLIDVTGDRAQPTITGKLGPEGIDGYYGEKTRALVAQWQAKNGFDPTGNVTADQLEYLNTKSDATAYFEGEKYISVSWSKR